MILNILEQDGIFSNRGFGASDTSQWDHYFRVVLIFHNVKSNSLRATIAAIITTFSGIKSMKRQGWNRLGNTFHGFDDASGFADARQARQKDLVREGHVLDGNESQRNKSQLHSKPFFSWQMLYIYGGCALVLLSNVA